MAATYSNDKRACPKCGRAVYEHPPKGQLRKGGCPYTRGKVVELLSRPQPFKIARRPSLPEMESELKRRGVL